MIVELLVITHMPAGVLTLIVSMAPLATLLFAWMMKTDTIDLQLIHWRDHRTPLDETMKALGYELVIAALSQWK